MNNFKLTFQFNDGNRITAEFDNQATTGEVTQMIAKAISYRSRLAKELRDDNGKPLVKRVSNLVPSRSFKIALTENGKHVSTQLDGIEIKRAALDEAGLVAKVVNVVVRAVLEENETIMHLATIQSEAVLN